MVQFNQTTNDKKKDVYLKILFASRNLTNVKPILKSQYEYLSRWYHPVVRELLVTDLLYADPVILAKTLNPMISSKQAAKSIALLEKLGLIYKNSDGKWSSKDQVMDTGPEVASASAVQYHLQAIELAKEAIEKIPYTEREISSLTLGISAQDLPKIKEKIIHFQNELIELAGASGNGEVVQINFQMFPLTNQYKREVKL